VFLLADGSPKVSGFGGWIDDGATGDEALAGTSRLLPYFQNEITEETRQRDVRAIGQLLYMMLTGRAPPESVMAGNSKPSGEPGSITRSARAQTPAALARLVDQALLVGQVDGPKTAGALRDALTAFIWNERAENVAPNSLGIPLAPPPLRAPVHVATITPDDNVAPLREVLATAPVPATVARPAPTHPIPTAAPAADATAPVAAETTLLAPVPPAPAPAPIVPGAGETGPSAFDPHALLEALRPWAIKYRVPLFAVGAFFSLSIFLGVLLGNLRHTPPAATTPASVDSGTAGDTATAADRPASGPKAPVSFDIRPWGEIFIDGKATGVSPPMTQLELTSGHHHVEIHHEPFPAWSADVDVHGTTPIRIEHGFE
jgi:hypothetical protein